MKTTIPLAYYMPIYLLTKAKASGDETLLDFCELFNIVNTNACVIDRTGSLTTPFNTKSLWPLQPQADSVKDFGTLCIERAAEILNEGRTVHFMYSGGLDSTCMLLAFHHVLKQTGNYEQLVIATSPDAQSENPDAWKQIVRPYYKLTQAREMLANLDLATCRYVQGENADQMFGSDRVLSDPELLHQTFTPDNLRNFLASKITRPKALERLHSEFMTLTEKCPLDIDYMRDFLWWMNFTCKWQSVALRTLSFSNVFENNARVTESQLKQFETFFNTVSFQQLSTSGTLDRWGASPTAYTYKQAARDFILAHTGWTTYVNMKMKVGSLYNVIRQRTYVADAVGYEDGCLFATTL